MVTGGAGEDYLRTLYDKHASCWIASIAGQQRFTALSIHLRALTARVLDQASSIRGGRSCRCGSQLWVVGW